MKRIQCIVMCLVATVSLSAANSERQMRKVHINQIWNCSAERANEVIDQFVYEIQTDMNHLFTWAFLGTESAGDTKGKDAVSIKYVGNTYDQPTRTGTLITTIEVLGVPWFKNREVGSIYTDSVLDATRFARLDVTYSGSLLQAADGQFHTKSLKDDTTSVHFELNVILGKFFSAFVTNKIWKENAEWRIQTIVSNLKEFAETGRVTTIPNNAPKK